MINNATLRAAEAKASFDAPTLAVPLQPALRTEFDFANLSDVPALMTPRMIAELAHVSTRTVRRWLAEDRLRGSRTAQSGSGRVLVRREDVFALLGLGE